MTWGVVPMNDRRLVILDEVSGLAEKGVIEQMDAPSTIYNSPNTEFIARFVGFENFFELTRG